MAYIHGETFEILRYGVENEDYFHVDDLIALPVQALNRKGYVTEMCCAGHPFCVKTKDFDVERFEAYVAENQD